MRYQSGLDSTKAWLRNASKLEIEDILDKAGLSEQKARIILLKYCKEKSRFQISTDDKVNLNETGVSKKTTSALRKIHAALQWIEVSLLGN